MKQLIADHMISDLIVKNRILLLLVSLTVGAVFFAFIPQVKNIEDVDHFVIKNDPDNLYYNKFKSVFGNDEFFIISFELLDIFSKENLILIDSITKKIELIEEVKDVKSLSNVDDTVGSEDYFEVRRFIENLPETKNDSTKLRKSAVENPIYLKNLLSTDAKTTAIIVEAYDKPEDLRYRHRLILKVKDILNQYQGIKFHLAGKTITDTTMSDFMERDVSLLIPISYILIVFCTFFFYRNFYLTLLAIVNISFCLGSTIGFLGLTNITQNSITSIVLPLVMALALCDTVHLYSHMTWDILDGCGSNRYRALKKVIQDVIKPCFFTSVTTFIGFFSLYFNQLAPIREFALTACAGICFEFFYSFFLLPPLLLFFKPHKLYKNYHKHNFVHGFLAIIAKTTVSHTNTILVIGGGLLAGSLIFASFINIETNITEFFKKNSDIRQSLQFVEKRLAGIESLDIALESRDEDAFKDPKNLKRIEKIQNFVDSLPGVDKTISLTDFIKDINKSFHNEDESFYRVPGEKNLISQYLLLYDSDDIEDYVNESYAYARISVRISEHNSNVQRNLIQQIDSFIKKVETADLDIRITGRVLQDVNVIDSIFKGQIQSLGFALLLISCILFFLFKSLIIGTISIIPNIFPILMNFGLMGVSGIPLNTATALISSVAIGIAVDDTIHFLTEFKQQIKTNSLELAVQNVIQTKGRAILSSSLILFLGFGILSFSNFVPTVHFGLLCAVIMISAVVADLFILPACLIYREKNRKYKTERV